MGNLLVMTPELVRTTRAQGGCFTYTQALDSGVTWSELRCAVDRGHVVRILPRVYAFSGTPVDQRLRSHAALLQYGPEAGLSHLSAGSRWAMTAPTTSVTITIPHDNRLTLREPWLVVHRTRHPDVVVMAGTALTPRPRTLIDLASLLPEKELTAVLLRVIQNQQVTAKEVTALLERLGSRPGSARMRKVLKEYDPGYESHLNKALFEIVVWAGYPEAEMGFTIQLENGTKVCPDTVLRRIKQGFEADGTEPHSKLRQIKHDKWKDRQLAIVGWANARFTTEECLRWKRQTRREVQSIVRQRELELRRSV